MSLIQYSLNPQRYTHCVKTLSAHVKTCRRSTGVSISKIRKVPASEPQRDMTVSTISQYTAIL